MGQASPPKSGDRNHSRTKLESQLRASEAHFRLLVHSVKDYAIFMLDPHGCVASWNEGAGRIKGYAAEEIVGRHFSAFYPEDDVRSGKCEWELEEASRTGRFEDEGWRVRKDGTMFWANVIITALRDEKRELLGFAKVTRDLTERKRAEDRLHRAYNELERRVHERTEDLRIANESLARRESELREALQVKDQFLSVASHELKTPITSLRMQLQMLQARVSPPRAEAPTPERLQKFLGISLAQVERLNQLVESLLDVARAGARKLTFQFAPTDLRALADEVFERAQVQADAARCTLHLDAPDVLTAEVDRFRIDQVLVNLISNAFKYAPGTRVQVSLREDLDRVELTVRDGGPGVPASARQRLFERFERGANVGNVHGLGLGLFIAREIVHGHHGTIRLLDEQSPGAAFRVELPLKQPGKNGDGFTAGEGRA